jgi:ABC-type antimicrobial peptide transport system permease subunit
VSGTQPAIFGGAIGVIAAVIAAAAIIPARRAASVEPASALRAD